MLIYFFYTPSLIFWCILLPFGTIMFLRRNKKHLYEIDFKMKFGFIYQEYDEKSYYMELFKTSLKLFVVAA